MKTKIGQIFLTHPKDQNYTSLYEESFAKQGQSVELFAVLEVANVSSKQQKTEYEKLAQLLVSALKRAYVTAPAIDENTFERALTSANTALSRALSRGKTNWYGKLHAAVGALARGQLAISATGNAVIYLWRGGGLVNLSEDLSEEKTRAVKIFSNFSTGRLASGDRLIFSTKQLFNYLSVDRVREFLGEDDLSEVCREMIGALAEAKTVGFATFVLEINPRKAADDADPLIEVREAPAGRESAAVQALRIAWGIMTSILAGLWLLARKIFRSRQKKYVTGALVLALVILGGALAREAWSKHRQNQRSQEQQTAQSITEKLDQAEAALIYGDDDKVFALMNEAEELLKQIQNENLGARLQALQDKLNKEVRIDNPTVLTAFPNIPTHLLRSPNGFLGFNRDSQSISFYDFRSGETRTILQNQNTGSLLLGAYLGGPAGFVFLDKDGKFTKLDVSGQTLTQYAANAPNIDLTAAKIRAMQILGEGEGARIYLLDPKQSQIWRLRAAEKEITAAEPWLKSPAALTDAVDFAVDGNIYALYAGRADKYFNGQAQTFALSPVSPPLVGASRIFATADTQSIYILDGQNKRVVIYGKTGKLQKQILSPKFQNLADVFVDEKNGIMYALSGGELLQINLK